MSAADFDLMMGQAQISPIPQATPGGPSQKPDLPDDYAPGGHWQVVQSGFDPATQKTIPVTDPDYPASALQAAKMNAALTLRKDSVELDYYYDKGQGQWIIYQIQNPTLYTSEAEANAEIANRMKAGAHTGTPLWKAYHPEKEVGWRIMDNPDIANLIDPDNPIRDQFDLDNGQTLYVLSNGKSFTGPTKADMDWTGWDAKKNIQKMGDHEFAIMPCSVVGQPDPLDGRHPVPGSDTDQYRGPEGGLRLAAEWAPRMEA